MNIKKKLLLLPVMIVLITGCTQKAMNSETAIEPPASDTSVKPVENGLKDTKDTTNVPVEDDMMESESSSININMENFIFSVKEIQASAGETITIHLTNKEGMHDFMIDELKVKSKTLNVGQTQDLEIKIPADAKGKTFEFYCSVGNHRQMGMNGKLVVN